MHRTALQSFQKAKSEEFHSSRLLVDVLVGRYHGLEQVLGGAMLHLV